MGSQKEKAHERQHQAALSARDAGYAVLYQNDDYGREYLRSFKAELARLDPQAEIAAAAPYEVTQPTVESQVVSLASTKANVFPNASTGKFTSQAIRKASEVGWLLEVEREMGSALKITDVHEQVAGVYPKVMIDGQMDAGAWSCGMVVGLIYDVPTVRELINRIMVEAEQIIRGRLTGLLNGPIDTNSTGAVAQGE